ncbi:MAG TPA: hypothetical protein VFE50_03590 [Cyclobacteriaceae bacterium]|nr:hypothetical protein [Cyclobacteriaceae bacterium]
MKLISSLIVPVLTFLALGFDFKPGIHGCYISFKSPTNLTAGAPERLPEAARTSRPVSTNGGEVEITRIDGYRVLYNNGKNVPFVNLKVELSESGSYKADQKNLVENLKYLISNSSGMETKDVIELEFNGLKVYGLSRGSIESGSTLGIFVMFPGDDLVVYFYFNNLKPEYRNFESLEDYKRQRDKFMEEYTKHLKSCKE